MRQSLLDHLVYATPDLEAAITGPRLVQLRLEHPEPELIRKQLNSLGLDVAIEQGSSLALIAIFEGADGLIELR